jgi:hypothetical protein
MKKLMISLSLVGLFSLPVLAENSQNAKNVKPIEKQKVNFNLPAFNQYLKIGNAQQLEGIYSTKDRRYFIALVKNSEKTHDFIGIVLAADNSYWDRGEVKFNFSEGKDGKLEGFYYDQKGHANPVIFEAGQQVKVGSQVLEKLTEKQLQIYQLSNYFASL